MGDLNPDVTEGNLYEIFNAFGNVTTIRVCRNATTRESLGYAYVNFQTPADAEKAMAGMNCELIKGRPCRIMWAQRDPTARRNNVGNVFVKNLPPTLTSRVLYNVLAKDCKYGVLSCKIAMDEKGVSKGYGFVHLDTAEAAQGTIELLNGMEMDNHKLVCMPYVQKQQRGSPEYNNLFVKNIPKEWTQKQLYDTFAPFGEIGSAVIKTDASGASMGFGFVCYSKHESALEAESKLNGKEVEGTPVNPTVSKKAAAESDSKTATAATTMKLYVGRHQKKSERDRATREARDAVRREQQAKWQGCNLYVRNLDESVDDAMLRTEFGKFGAIQSALVAREKDGRSKLFGYVCFSSAEEASKALSEMNRKMLAGKPLYVQLWQPKESRQATLAAAQRAVNRATTHQAAANPLAAFANNPAVAATLSNPAFLAALQAGRPAAAPTDPAMQQQQMNMLMYLAFLQQQVAATHRGGMVPPGRMPPGPAQMQPGARPAMAGMPLLQMLGAVGANVNPAAANAGARGGQRVQNKAAAGGPAAGQRGPAPAGTQPRQPAATTAAAVVRGTATATKPAPQARPAEYRPGVRNVAEEATTGAAVLPSGIPPVVAPAAVAVPFATQLASAPPAMRKQMIGERLYALISAKEVERANKVTGMLLEAMDEGELLHLLEAPEELVQRIREAVSVLKEHEMKPAQQ